MNYPKSKLGEVATIVTGSTPSKANESYWNGNIPFVTPSELDGDQDVISAEAYVTEEGASVARLVPKNSIMVCCIGSLGKVGVAGCDLLTNQQINTLVFDPKKVNFRYGYHFCKTLKPYLEHIAPSTTVAIVNKSRFSEIEIPLPPLEEQKRIAAILDKADSLRRKRAQAIALADDFLRATFLDLFGDPVTNPKGWCKDALINLCSGKMLNGAYYPSENYCSNGTKMVHMGDAFYDVVKTEKLKTVNCSEADKRKYQLTANDILISRRSLTYEGAAKPSLIPDCDETIIFESSLIRVTPDNDKIRTKFLFQYLSTPCVKEQIIRKYVTGATIKGISQSNLEMIEVIFPPVPLQDRFIALQEKMSLIKNKLLIGDLNLSKSLNQLLL